MMMFATATVFTSAASTQLRVDRERGISGVVLAQVFGGAMAPYFKELLNVLSTPMPMASQ